MWVLSARGPEAVPFEWWAGEVAAPETAPTAAGMEFTRKADAVALQEMLEGSRGRQWWSQAPSLTVLESVLKYERGPFTEYAATEEVLSAGTVDKLVADMTRSLALLTDNTFAQFADVNRERVAPGTKVAVSRPGQIVVARYRDVRKLLDTVGFGGRSSRADGMITRGAIVLDNDFDRSSDLRQLLRTHELGHALGYNHVTATTSIMNPRIGSEPTDFDRKAIRLAFRMPQALRERSH